MQVTQVLVRSRASTPIAGPSSEALKPSASTLTASALPSPSASTRRFTRSDFAVKKSGAKFAFHFS